MTSASAVSRALRVGGLRPLPSGTPYTREGLRVSRSLQRVRVVADLDSEARAAELATLAAAILSEAGYTIDPTDQPVAFYVTSRTP